MVRIVPDDTNADENTSVFDKLNIAQIDVTRSSASGLVRNWTIEKPGWIEIDYRDEGGENTIHGQDPRTIGEVTRDFAVTKSSYSSRLLVTISNAMGSEEVSSVEGDTFKTIQGSVTATVYYENSEGGTEEKEIDVIEEMAKYNGTSAVKVVYNTTGDAYVEARYADTTSLDLTNVIKVESERVVESEGLEYFDLTEYVASKGEMPSTLKTFIDTNYMLRPCSTDRFIIELKDVQSILGMELRVDSLVDSYWDIGRISIFQIGGSAETKLRINENKEFIKYNDSDLTPVTDSEEEFIRINLTKGGIASRYIDFREVDFTFETDSEEWSTNISGDNQSRFSTLNLYIHPASTISARDLYNFDSIDAVIKYYNTRLQAQQEITVKKLDIDTSDPANPLLVATGLSAKDLGYIAGLTIMAHGDESYSYPCNVNYAVIQNVSSGVLVHTDYFRYNGFNANVKGGVGVSPISPPNDKRQAVTLFFSDDSVASELTTDQNDVAVAIRYTSTNGNDGAVYSSNYHFLSQERTSGNAPIYTEVKGGLVATIVFDEPFIREITGITLACTGILSCGVDCAYVEEYTVDKDGVRNKNVESKWVNVSGGMTLTHRPETLPATANKVADVQMTLTTSDVSEDAERTGTNDSIRMVVNYYNSNLGVSKILQLDDIRNYLVSGGFGDGETAVIRFLMKDTGRIRSISLEPYDKDMYNTCDWKVKEVNITYTVDGKKTEKNRTMEDKFIIEGDPRLVGLADVTISTLATRFDKNGNKQTGEKAGTINQPVDMLIDSGDVVSVQVELAQNAIGYGVIYDLMQVDDSSTMELDKRYSNMEKVENTGGKNIWKIDLFLPENKSTMVTKYVLLVKYEELPDVQAKVNIKVLPSSGGSGGTTEPVAPVTSAAPEATGGDTEP